MSVVVIATLTPNAGCKDDVVALVSARVADVHDELGCQLYALHDAGDRVVFVEQWADKESLDLHAGGAVMAAMQVDLEGRLSEPAEVVVASPVPAGHLAQGLLRP